MNRAGPSVNIQVRLKYQDFLKIRWNQGPACITGPRGLTKPRIPRPQGSRPALERLGQSGCVGAGVGPWARETTWPASWPAVAARPAMRVACAAPAAPLVLAADRRSGPKTAGVRGHASGRRPDRTATEEPVITMIFQNRCWVFRPDVEFTGKGGEEPLSGEEGRAPPLECPAVRRPNAGPTWRDCGGIEDQVSPERGAERWMVHEHGELGIGPGEPGTPAGVNIASLGITDF